MNRYLKENTEVILSKNNPWESRNVVSLGDNSNPIDKIGTIVEIREENPRMVFLSNNISVVWSNDSTNCYRHTDSDLIPVSGKYSREVLRRIARNEGLTVADLGISSDFRWQLAAKEI